MQIRVKDSSSHEIYQFCAATLEEKKSWIADISQVIENISAAKAHFRYSFFLFSFSYKNRSKSPTHTSHKLSSRQKISKGSQLSFIFENNPASKVADMPAQLPKFKVVDISKHQLLVSHDGPSEKSPEYVSLTFVDQV